MAKRGRGRPSFESQIRELGDQIDDLEMGDSDIQDAVKKIKADPEMPIFTTKELRALKDEVDKEMAEMPLHTSSVEEGMEFEEAAKQLEQQLRKASRNKNSKPSKSTLKRVKKMDYRACAAFLASRKGKRGRPSKEIRAKLRHCHAVIKAHQKSQKSQKSKKKSKTSAQKEKGSKKRWSYAFAKAYLCRNRGKGRPTAEVSARIAKAKKIVAAREGKNWGGKNSCKKNKKSAKTSSKKLARRVKSTSFSSAVKKLHKLVKSRGRGRPPKKIASLVKQAKNLVCKADL